MRAKTTNFGIFFALITILLTGCSTRSISNSGYQDDNGCCYGRRQTNPFYQGELNELSMLGISAEQAISEADIQAALNDAATVTLKRGDAVLLIQSGAMFPDDDMLQAMRDYFAVTPLSGIPDQPKQAAQGETVTPPAPLKQVLRLTAAQTGATAVIVYWGIIETAQEDQVTKVISWAPFLGQLIPDEVQRMRIRLKGVVMDVKSGKWLMLTPPEADSSTISGRLEREAADQQQVARMKTQAYQNFMQTLRQRFAIQ